MRHLAVFCSIYIKKAAITLSPTLSLLYIALFRSNFSLIAAFDVEARALYAFQPAFHPEICTTAVPPPNIYTKN